MLVYEQALERWIQEEPMEVIDNALESAENARGTSGTIIAFKMWESKANELKEKYDLQENKKSQNPSCSKSA